MILLLGIIGTIVNFIKYRENGVRIKNNLINALPYAIILLMPLVWFFVLREHSYDHQCFTYRSLLLVMTSIPIILLKISETVKFEEEK